MCQEVLAVLKHPSFLQQSCKLLTGAETTFFASGLSMLISIRDIQKNPAQVVLVSLQLLMQQGCNGFRPGLGGLPAPHGCRPTSCASAPLHGSGLILQKHLFCVERFFSVAARYFSDQSSLCRAYPPPAATQAVTWSSSPRDASHTGSGRAA